MGLCDFCSTPDPAWTYPADDIFLVPGDDTEPVHQSVGAWAACDDCSAAIEAGDMDALLQRCLVHSRELGVPDRAAMPALRDLFVAFFTSRRGERRML